MERKEKEILSKIFCLSLEGSKGFERLGEDLDDKELQILNSLQEKGYIDKKEVTLTDKGRKIIKVILAGGVFDIIHPGHIYTLNHAKNLGDILIVSVARDSTVRKMKGREPLHNEKERLKLVSSLKMVDLALLGSEKDIFETVIKVKPDVIVLGYDQRHNERELIARGKKENLDFQVIRLSSPIPHVKTSNIVADEDSLKEI
ncbi:MAG: adenylyltransferase/cytidyltransferase family protein [Nitrososphaerales archaeon]